MSGGLDVEALLEEEANKRVKAEEPRKPHEHDERRRDRGGRDDRRGRRDRDRSRNGHRRSRDGEADVDMRTPPSDRSRNGSNRSHRYTRSPDSDRRAHRQPKDTADDDDNSRVAGGDYYRGGGRRPRTRSRSPDRDRYYRPRNRRDERDRYRVRERDERRHPGPDRDPNREHSPRHSRSHSPELNEDERDKRTIFVQQLANRLRTRDLIAFFEKVGPVKEAQIVKDRISGRSKGVGYVEFKDEESVSKAIQLTGQKLLGIPIIAQLTEAEKNRQARTTSSTHNGNANSVPFHRLYVGNIHFSISESDLTNVFSPFGDLEFVSLQKDEGGRSKGFGFVQFHDPSEAKEALEKMNGFELAGRPIRVGLGNERYPSQSTDSLLQRFQGQGQQFQGSAFSGHGGRGTQAGGSGGSFDRASGRDNEKSAGGASALDDTDVHGVNFSNYSRDALMRKLARTDDPTSEQANTTRNNIRPKAEAKPVIGEPVASKCIIVRNAFDPQAEYANYGDAWTKQLEDEIRNECEEKYGKVVHIAVDPNTQGDIYIKFDNLRGGEKALQGLNGRFFDGKTLTASPVVDAVYNTLFPMA